MSWPENFGRNCFVWCPFIFHFLLKRFTFFGEKSWLFLREPVKTWKLLKMIKLISFVLFVISYFMQEGSLDCMYVDCEGKNSRNREKTFYLLHASKPQFSPYFLLKRTHTLHTLLKFHSKSRNLTLFKEGYLPTWKSFYFLQLPTIQVALIFIACFTQNPTLTTSTLWWDSFLNCILIVFLIFTIYLSNLCITIRSDYNLNILWNISWNRKCVK